MSSYESFAQYYDKLNSNVDYKARGEYILSLFDKFGNPPKTLLDLACGTGTLLKFFAQKGMDLIGVDASPDMLSIARDRLFEKYPSVLLLCQRMDELDLYGTVEGGISTLDSFNHLSSIDEIAAVFGRLKFFIESNGLFIFDMNTPYKHKNILGNNSFVLENEDVFCVWQNEYFDEQNRVDICLDFFTPNGDLWDRTEEEFSERAYEPEQILDAAKRNCFEPVAVYEDMSFNKPNEKSERIIYIIRRKGM